MSRRVLSRFIYFRMKEMRVYKFLMGLHLTKRISRDSATLPDLCSSPRPLSSSFVFLSPGGGYTTLRSLSYVLGLLIKILRLNCTLDELLLSSFILNQSTLNVFFFFTMILLLTGLPFSSPIDQNSPHTRRPEMSA